MGRLVNNATAGVLAGLLAAPLLATSATASTPRATVPRIPSGASVSQAQQIADTVVANGETVLTNLSAEIAASTTLSATDRVGLNGIISGDSAVLAQVQAEVAADSSTAAVQGNLASVVDLHLTDFVRPAVSVVLSVDQTLSVAAHLSAEESPLQAAITAEGRLKSAGTAESLFRELEHKLAFVASETATTNSSLISAEPSIDPDFGQVLSSATTEAKRAAAAAKHADADVAAIVALLAHPGQSSAARR